MEIELETGEFYTSEQDGFDPVVIWLGRVDLPEDLEGVAAEPVLSLMVRAAEEGSPVIEMAPFWQGVVMTAEFMEADPFYVDEAVFEDSYHIWRNAYDQGEAFPWTMSPNEVYARMLGEMDDEDA
ncbi:hypothetical protein EOK75_10310 [Pseudorhodobacter turbinis]|uniref:Uncharacterized protein n=1 Tax=Pseudorhodobacter turbinis TaxID=2500533 RepID=A0A4P8EGP2_9RHOB|nr:hypothetical protein [Pseudorhodobacter turbinis]QCO56086.1 hypothetical protein EOK75_10310 [Pseudorhodobacter turbinis]